MDVKLLRLVVKKILKIKKYIYLYIRCWILTIFIYCTWFPPKKYFSHDSNLMNSRKHKMKLILSSTIIKIFAKWKGLRMSMIFPLEVVNSSEINTWQQNKIKLGINRSWNSFSLSPRLVVLNFNLRFYLFSFFVVIVVYVMQYLPLHEKNVAYYCPLWENCSSLSWVCSLLQTTNILSWKKKLKKSKRGPKTRLF